MQSVMENVIDLIGIARMHEQAVLTTNHPRLGGIGSLVGIDQIEALYKTSASANDAVKVKCANPSCGVKVSIVIPDKEKEGRKTSPSAHFRGRHPDGCDRKPKDSSTTTTNTSSQLEAKPVRKDFPQVWVDPSSAAVSSSVNSLAPTNDDQHAHSGVGGRSRSGSGTSEGESGMLEKFARAWLEMTVQSRKINPLKAPWNSEGTYNSAFHAFDLHDTKFLGKVGVRIFTAPVLSVLEAGEDFDISLQDKTPGRALKVVVIKSEAFGIGASGRALLNQLKTFDSDSKVFLFFLGGFKYNSDVGRFELIIKHPHFIYIDFLGV